MPLNTTLKRDKDSGSRAFVEPVILVARITRPENWKEEESLGYIGRHCLKANIKEKIYLFVCMGVWSACTFAHQKRVPDPMVLQL